MVRELEAAGAWEGGGGRYMMGEFHRERENFFFRKLPWPPIELTQPSDRKLIQATTSTPVQRCDTKPTISLLSCSIRSVLALVSPVTVFAKPESLFHPFSQPTNTYYPWSECKPRLDATPSGMATFSGPFPSPPPPPQQQPSLSTSTSASSSAADPSTVPPVTSTAPPDPTGDDLELAETACSSGEHDDDDNDDDAELDTDFPSPPPPGCLDPNNLPIELLAETFVIQRRTLMPFLVRPTPVTHHAAGLRSIELTNATTPLLFFVQLSDAWRDPELQREARELLATVGEAGRKRLAIFFGR